MENIEEPGETRVSMPAAAPPGPQPPPPPAPKKGCPKCFRPVDADAEYCPRCGARQGGGDGWYFHPVWILVLAFAVLGPFALFLVWKSKRMGFAVKLLMAAVILAYTFMCVWSTYELIAFELRHINDFREMMRELSGK